MTKKIIKKIKINETIKNLEDIIHNLEVENKILLDDKKTVYENAEKLEKLLIQTDKEKDFWKSKNDEKVEVIKKLENQVDKLINYFIA